MSRSAPLIGLLLTSVLASCSWVSTGGDANSSSSSSGGVASSWDERIRVFEPTPNQVVKSPLTIRGEARGQWYFEASFPVQLLDKDGNQIAIAPAQAQGEWMTTEFVPFELMLPFSTDSPTGTLVLEKDNPSGLPEHAASVEIPVRFIP